MTLRVEGLTKRFAGLTAVDGLTFEAPSRQITALIGPNGAGKTTMLSMASGLIAPSAGAVIFDGTDLTGLSGHRIAGLGIARTYQNLQMFEDMSVLEVVMTGAHRAGRASLLGMLVRSPAARRDEQEIEALARETLRRVSIPDGLLDREAVSLAYGLQRRVEIARALVSRPRLLLLDEPAAGLNPRETAELAALISTLRQDGLTVLLVEHDMEMVMSLSDKIVVMSFGRLLAQGRPADIQADPAVVEAYLGTEN